MSRPTTATLVTALVAVVAAPQADVPAMVALVVETSESVPAADLARAGDVGAAIVQGLPYGAQAFVLAFGAPPRVVIDATADAEAIRGALADLKPSGSAAALHAALGDAARRLDAAGVETRAIVVLASGADTTGQPRDAALASGIPVFTVGLGEPAEQILRDIAARTGGRYVPLRQASGFEIAAQVQDARRAAHPAASSEPARRTTSAAPPDLRSRIGVLVAVVALGLALAAASLLVWIVRRRAAGAPARTATTGQVRRGGDHPKAAPVPGTLLMPQPDAPPVDKTLLLSQQASLKMLEGPSPGRVFTFSDRATSSVGRSPGNEIVLDDHAVSGQHCRIRPEKGRFVLHDLGSTNGTYVNEERVDQKVLKRGDVIRIGKIRLEFE